MAETVELAAEKRQGKGSGKAAKLRKQGRTPAVVYGHKEETLSLSVASAELLSVITRKARVVDLKVDGGVQKALIRELQWDHLGKDILHVDFYRVSADERITVVVPLELRGIAPGVAGGGVLDQPLHNVEVECLAIAVPQSIRVNINELQIGQAIHVRDLHLPEGVTATGDADAVVVHVTTPQAETEPGAEVPTGGVEPEVIGRKAGEEEEKTE